MFCIIRKKTACVGVTPNKSMHSSHQASRMVTFPSLRVCFMHIAQSSRGLCQQLSLHRKNLFASFVQLHEIWKRHLNSVLLANWSFTARLILIFQHLDDFPAPFLFQSSSLDRLSVSPISVAEIPSAPSFFFAIFMWFLRPRHGVEEWNQQKLMDFWLQQWSQYSDHYGWKTEKENHRKNSCHILHSF